MLATEGWLGKGARIAAEMHSLTLLLPETASARTRERIPMFMAGLGSGGSGATVNASAGSAGLPFGVFLRVAAILKVLPMTWE